jgi:radical SAM superfamily enzyme YgiQ (UPF0313 family)
MKVLLLSMPDSFEHTPADAVRMPNAALTSLAGNVDQHHRIAVADLILVQSRVRETVTRLVAEQAPDVVGLSIMTFQRKTAKAIIRLVRSLRPSAHIVVGGYDPSLAVDAYTDLSDDGADFIVRGEGEITFRQLLCTIESGKGVTTKSRGFHSEEKGASSTTRRGPSASPTMGTYACRTAARACSRATPCSACRPTSSRLRAVVLLTAASVRSSPCVAGTSIHSISIEC